MSASNMDRLINIIDAIDIKEKEIVLSFEGKQLKLDTAEHAEVIVNEIDSKSNLTALILKGNTINIPAADRIAQSLKKCRNLKYALWSDMFTGRSKLESPPALKLMSDALITAQVTLIELDLSDNAFGPAGAESIKNLLQSPSCYSLEILKLNNDGLGIGGGKIIAESLISCWKNAKNAGRTFGLKVFVAGRNRLENDGAKALADAFKIMGTLEEVTLPQNGIYFDGVNALVEAFKHNPNLKCINLEDNTLAAFGAIAVAKALPKLGKLRILNLNDCLMRSKGAAKLAKSIKHHCDNLEELLVCGNELNKTTALEIGEAIFAKGHLKKVDFGGNNIGISGIEELTALFKEHEVEEKLLFSCEDEGTASEGDLDDFEDIENEYADEDENEPRPKEDQEEEEGTDHEDVCYEEEAYYETVGQFLSTFEEETLCDLGDDGPFRIVERVQDELQDPYYATHLLLRISNLITPNCHHQVEELAYTTCSYILKSCFNNHFADVLCQKLGLIKNEFSPIQRPKNFYGILHVLKGECKETSFEPIRDVLKFFVKRKIDNKEKDAGDWVDLYQIL